MYYKYYYLIHILQNLDIKKLTIYTYSVQISLGST